MEIVAFDSHKRYTLARVERTDGQLLKEERINHYRCPEIHKVSLSSTQVLAEKYP